MKQNLILGVSFIVFTVIVTIVGYFILPDTLVMQITLSGDAGTTMCKIFGLIIMLVLGSGAGVFVIFNQQKEQKLRSYLVLIILFIVYIMVFVFNL